MIISVCKCDKCGKMQKINTDGDNSSGIFTFQHKEGNIDYSLDICKNCFLLAFHSYSQPQRPTLTNIENHDYHGLKFKRKR